MIPAAIKPVIDLDTFFSVDLRVGTIEAVEEIAGSSKLVRLIVNFPPRKMAGEVSEGMIVDIGSADGLVPALATPEWPMPDGARAG
jgi:tRNA-binding protein